MDTIINGQPIGRFEIIAEVVRDWQQRRLRNVVERASIASTVTVCGLCSCTHCWVSRNVPAIAFAHMIANGATVAPATTM